MKQAQRRDFLTVVLFFGILVSFMLYLGVGLLISGEEPFLDWAEEDKQERSGFNELFCEDEAINRLIQYCDLRIFRHVNNPDILIGSSDWLFEVDDEDTGYNYLLDYVGGSPYSEDELKQIGQILEKRRAEFEAMGTEYRLLVIPNSMTVCSQYMPGFVGRQSERTQLRMLTAYMRSIGAGYFLNPMDTMLEDSKELGALYQNTEDAINAHGAYSLYRMLSKAIGCQNPLSAENVNFVVHMTEGRKVAALAGVEKLVPNRTVSLTDAMADGYRIINEEQCLRVEMQDATAGEDTRLMLCFSDSWDRIQLMPFFSNTYDTVLYRDGEAQRSDIARYAPDFLVEVIHESELEHWLDKVK